MALLNIMKPPEMMDLQRVLKWIAGLALGAALAAAHANAWAQQAADSWKGMDRVEAAHPEYQRKDTLNFFRSNGNIDDTVRDQKSVVGFGTAAATGTVEPRVKPGTTESLEIMKKGELSTQSR